VETPGFHRYEVNLFVDVGWSTGAPVVEEPNPTFANLVGRVEYVAHLGALVTDFSLLRAGALHRANGGYLILEARQVLTQPYAWEALKRALRSREIRIESLGQALGLVSTVSLEPEPIPLQVKVALVGDRLLYYLLCEHDPEFPELFKVEADFEERVGRTPENDLVYAHLLGSLARKNGLRPLDRGAVACVIEHAARLVGDAQRLSTHVRDLSDLLDEADFLAGDGERKAIAAADVEAAIEARTRRAGRLRERVHEEIGRGTVRIETDGLAVGQVNGLAVAEAGGFSFGWPGRITAQIGLGRGEVVDIEREVELGGPIHSKGVLILGGFLTGRFGRERPLTLRASLVFEQSYGQVEGDSASLAETCALLSAIAEAPIHQALAVTGSVDQLGQVQAIGAANEKIEGFFDICAARGLTGQQGVLIPSTNVDMLMLRHDVVAATEQGRFHVWAVETIDQAMELLTGVSAGERDEAGAYPPDSINGRVEARLVRLLELARELETEGGGSGRRARTSRHGGAGDQH
jgi:predicted ATP-dependent protease